MTKRTLLAEFQKLKVKFITWPDFENATGIPRSQLSRILCREITMTPDMADRLARVSKRSAKSWMRLWLDRWYDNPPVQSLHSRDGSATTHIAKE